MVPELQHTCKGHGSYHPRSLEASLNQTEKCWSCLLGLGFKIGVPTIPPKHQMNAPAQKAYKHLNSVDIWVAFSWWLKLVRLYSLYKNTIPKRRI